jgi:hypothetical protein
MRIRSTLPAFLLATLLFSATALRERPVAMKQPRAQTPAQAQQVPQQPRPEFSVEASLVNVNVGVVGVRQCTPAPGGA